MDPNAALRILLLDVEMGLDSEPMSPEAREDLLRSICEGVDALHGWLKAGGALPTDWDGPARKKVTR